MADIQSKEFTKEVAPKRGGSYGYIYTIEAIEHSTDVVNNKSSVTLKFYIKHETWDPAYNGHSTHCGISIDGRPVASGTVKKDIADENVLMLKYEGDISHDADGGKDAVISVWLYHNSSADYLPEDYTADEPLIMGTWSLTTIPRASKFSIIGTDFTLGNPLIIQVQNASTEFWQVLEYECGSVKGSVATGTNLGNVDFWPPEELATENTTGTTVSIRLTLYTYSGNTLIGENSILKTYKIPVSASPTLNLGISDGTGYASQYGGFLKGLSTLNIEAFAEPKYGAEITSCTITANGATYSGDSVYTDPLKNAGLQSVTARVTDSRGMTATTTVDITAIDYTSPTITAFRAFRCDSDGKENGRGEYIKVLFGAVVTNLSGNTATYTLKHKKSNDENYTDTVELSEYKNNFNVVNGSSRFSASTGSGYDVQLVVSDEFGNVTKTSAVSAGATYMSRYKDKVYSLGEEADVNDSNIHDVGVFNAAFGTRLKGGIIPVQLDYGTDLNDVATAGFYAGKETSGGSYLHSPLTSSGFFLDVGITGEGHLTQLIYPAGDEDVQRRFCKAGVWSEWQVLSGGEVETTDEAIEGDTRAISSGAVYNMLVLIDEALGQYMTLERHNRIISEIEDDLGEL